MKPSRRYAILLSLTLTLYATPTLAIGKRDITVTTAENGVQLSLSRGYGVVLNLSTIGQTVSTAWLSDPSQITLASNKGPCTGDACSGSSVLYLKPIDKLNFPGLPSASDGASLLSVITNRGQVLQFKLAVTSSVPSYTSIALVPQPIPLNSPTPRPPVPLQQARKPAIPVAPPAPVKEPEIVVSLPETSQEEELDTLAGLLNRPQPPQTSTDADPEVSNSKTITEPAKNSEPKKADAQTISQPEVKIPAKPKKDLQAKDKSKNDAELKSQPEIKIAIDTDSKTKQDASADEPEVTAPRTTEPANTHDEPKANEVIKTDEGNVVIAVLEPIEEPTQKPVVERTNQDLAGALLRGLHSPRGKKEVGRSIHYYRAQDVIWLLRKDKNISLTQALKRSRMDESVANTLINYGTP